jgi:hypothetical protein
MAPDVPPAAETVRPRGYAADRAAVGGVLLVPAVSRIAGNFTRPRAGR